MRTRSLAFCGCRTLTTEIASCTSVPAVQRARLCSSETRLAKSQYRKLVSHGFTTPVHLLSSMHRTPHALSILPFNIHVYAFSGRHAQGRIYPNCWMASFPVSRSAEMMPIAANLILINGTATPIPNRRFYAASCGCLPPACFIKFHRD